MIDASASKAADALSQLITRHRKLTVLTGAGCSTASGIPDYRDENGEWKHARPVQLKDFVTSPAVRRSYWARSFIGWPRIASARPNQAHRALAALERRGFVHQLITQNVDELHFRAGSRRVVNLHGVLSRVRCLACARDVSRDALQDQLERLNPEFAANDAVSRPDGDADISPRVTERFVVPNCRHCQGVLKPDVVFFGENVPRPRVARCVEQLKRSDALLVVGSSLMVFSGYRFARIAHAENIPIIIVNRGKTRADELALRRFSDDCGAALANAASALAA